MTDKTVQIFCEHLNIHILLIAVSILDCVVLYVTLTTERYIYILKTLNTCFRGRHYETWHSF